MRDWYNGYSWGGAERVYNPFDALLLFRKRKYKAWWFETGTPTFLVRTLAERRVHAATLEGALASEKLLGTFDVGRIATEALLFQTGYLTVAGVETEAGREFYRLGYPNREVRESLNESLLDYLTGDAWRPEEHLGPLRRILRDADFAGLEERIRALFAAIPHDWYRRNNIDRFEGHYASVMYAYFASLGQDVRAEDSGSRGRADLALRAGGRVYVFEFKVVERAGTRGGDGAAEGAGLRGQVPAPGRAGALWWEWSSASRRATSRGSRRNWREGRPSPVSTAADQLLAGIPTGESGSCHAVPNGAANSAAAAGAIRGCIRFCGAGYWSGAIRQGSVARARRSGCSQFAGKDDAGAGLESGTALRDQSCQESK